MGGWSTAILAADSGAILLDAGIWSISEGSLELGLGFLLRGLAIALPAVLLMSCTDPTDLADALAQKAKLPHRFVLGTLAAMRLVGLMAEEWQTIGMARRARGVGSHGNPLQRLQGHPGAELRAAGPGRPARLPAGGDHGSTRLRRRAADLGPEVDVQPVWTRGWSWAAC